MSPRQLYRKNERTLHSRLRVAEAQEDARRREVDFSRLDALHCDQPSPDDALAHCEPANLRRMIW